MTDVLVTIAILGGTGHEGPGLALRWAKAGYSVIIGSRAAEKALRVTAELNERLGDDLIHGMENHAAAVAADVAVLTVPYSAHHATLSQVKDALQGKVLVDVTVPLAPPDVTRVHVPEGVSAGQEAQALLGEGVRVVSAFQNISAHHLKDPDKPIDSDVLVCGDDRGACDDVIRLAEAAGMRGLYAGPLANSVAVEGLTPVLLGLGKQYRRLRVGVRITGIPRDAAAQDASGPPATND